MKEFPLRTLVMILPVLAAAYAQPLANLAPAESVLALSYNGPIETASTMVDDLATLDWERAIETVKQIGSFLAESGRSDDLSEAITLFQSGTFNEMITQGCAPLANFLEGDPPPLFGDEALLTISISPYNPLPSVTALTRFDDAQATRANQLQEIILACTREAAAEETITTLEQDGVPLYVIGDGSDLPIVIGGIGNLFFIGTNPETLRGVVRRANGAAEASLVDTELSGMMREAFQGGGFSASLNLALLADLLESFAAPFVEGPEIEHMLTRGLAILRTLSGFAANLNLSSDGVLFESLTAVNPEGGDSALAELLLCESCALSSNVIAPQSSLAITGRYLALEPLFDYLQGWLDDAEAVLGERINVREMLLEAWGLDVDAALFDWIGSEFYTVRLEPLSSDLYTLLYQPAQALVIEVTSVEAAKAGLSSYLPLLEALLPEGGDGDFTIDPLKQIATDSYDYQGVMIERYRFGPTFNVGVGYLNDFLVIGLPSYALEMLIDTSNGNLEGILVNPDYRSALAAAPSRVTGFSYRDDQTQLLHLADLGSLISQPLAFGISAGLQASLSKPEPSEDNEDEPLGAANMTGVKATVVLVPDSVSGVLPSEEVGGTSIVFYELTELSVGDTVAITLHSSDFDTYLYLVDRAAGTIIYENDDHEGSLSQSRLVFTVQEGTTYWVGVTSYQQNGVGAYTLNVMPAEENPDDLETYTPSPVDLTGYGATLLALWDSVSGVVGEDNSSTSSSYYELTGLTGGDEVTATLTSNDFDTRLKLIDSTSDTYLDASDDTSDTTRSQLTFTVREGVSYWLEVTSSGGTGVGSYTLTLSSAAPVVEAERRARLRAELPSFADLLHLTDILPQAMFIISNHLSYSEGYSQVRPDSIYSRTLMRIDW